VRRVADIGLGPPPARGPWQGKRSSGESAGSWEVPLCATRTDTQPHQHNFDRITPGPGPSTADMTKVEKDLQELKANLTALDGRVENINTAVAGQGRGLIKLDADIVALKGQVKANADAHQIALTAILSKLDDRTSAEIIQLLDTDTAFRTELTTHLKDAGQLPGAIEKIKAILKKAKP
jgi:hypothetical protein